MTHVEKIISVYLLFPLGDDINVTMTKKIIEIKKPDIFCQLKTKLINSMRIPHRLQFSHIKQPESE